MRRTLTTLALTLALFTAMTPTYAADAQQTIEQTLANAQQEKKGVMLYVHGQTVGGGVVRIEPGQWVELRSQQYGRIIVRLDRIDAVAMP